MLINPPSEARKNALPPPYSSRPLGLDKYQDYSVHSGRGRNIRKLMHDRWIPSSRIPFFAPFALRFGRRNVSVFRVLVRVFAETLREIAILA